MKPLFILLIGLFSTGFLSAQTHPGWIKQSVFYQIYPSSFQNNDGNGIGDIKGIQSRLDYIQSLGVNAVWLKPGFQNLHFRMESMM